MTSAPRAVDYLAIPVQYGGTLGGLVWSASGDALERWNGTTFAFAEEIREVLAGVFAREPVPPFEFVLAILRSLRDGPTSDSVGGKRLQNVFAAEKGTVQLLRHAGLLIGELCRTLPACPNPPTADDVASAVGRYPLADMWEMAGILVLPREEFDQRLEERLASFDESRLRQWLKFGCDAPGRAEPLADVLDSLPARVEKLLALARMEPRLAGAASLVPTLDGALSLPARKRSPDALPQGGYTDVTTRGEPERLLPGQFALEPDEFIRRFAERELLYFLREEPHQARRPERLVILDQGVRTWGGVRLALAAAALVFMRKEAKRVGRVRFATTAAPRPIDVQFTTVESLIGSLESSDLTATPAACLRDALLDADPEESRDVVLLTHPRALMENAVHSALADRAKLDRVFALTVDDRGRAELVQWREAGPDVVRRFKADLAAALAVEVRAEPSPAVAFDARGWAGDVEPIPFPFRPGLVGSVERMVFDHDGEWLVAHGKLGMLTALAEGTPAEILPRAFRDGLVLSRVDTVFGVPGGIVACGTLTSMRSGAMPPVRSVVAHYDRRSRTVRLHDLGPVVVDGQWSVIPKWNCVEIAQPGLGGGAIVDLSTNEICIYSQAVERRWPSRINPLKDPDLDDRSEPPRELHVYPVDDEGPWRVPSLLRVANGLVMQLGHRHLLAKQGVETRVMPVQDGKFLLNDAEVVRAVFARNTLALALKRAGELRLVAINVSENRILSEAKLTSAHDFTLSTDGLKIACIRSSNRALAIHAVSDLGRPRAETRSAGLHDKVQVWVRPNGSLQIAIGTHIHTFDAGVGVLDHQVLRGNPAAESDPAAQLLHLPTRYDWSRFPPLESAGGRHLAAIVDRFGQVVVYRRSGELAAIIVVCRERAAAWIPGGVFWGDPGLIGGPASPNAAAKIGAALFAGETT
jgi:hypothetical protein